MLSFNSIEMNSTRSDLHSRISCTKPAQLPLVLSARPPEQPVPPQKIDGRIIIMSEMLEVTDDTDTHTVAMKYALKSDVILHCAGYMSLVQEEGKTMLYLVHRIDEKSYDKQAFKRTLDCMKEEWKKWEDWR